ncbi:hypothetical protein [Halomicronema sp. CCY15110]|uniref:hypothetical protein n=1 Tax=Halomicronema sp. CCY15110 TaxID=2767773 RepID=UPI00194EFBD0|nr:hypothetical protein [Halomicronema sp. CCY15110]
MHLRKPLRPTLSALAGIAIASGIFGILGSGVAGLIAGSEAHKNRASDIALLSTSMGIAGIAGAITLSMTPPEN